MTALTKIEITGGAFLFALFHSSTSAMWLPGVVRVAMLVATTVVLWRFIASAGE